MAGEHDRLRSLIREHHLERREAQILEAAKPSLRIALDPSSPSGAGSHLGGSASLRSPDEWPRTAGGKPLGFIGQLCLEEMRRALPDSPLPPAGLLSFFYDVDEQPWGNYEDYVSGGWKVLYFPEPSLLREIQPPAGSARTGDLEAIRRLENAIGRSLNLGAIPVGNTSNSLAHQPIRFIPELTIPAPRSIAMEPLELVADSDFGNYWNLRDALRSEMAPAEPIHRSLGHPDSIQGCMQREVQFESRNEKLPAGVYSYYEHPRADELIPGAYDWQLLLQIDTDDALGSMWGDAGRIYYWIHRQALAARDFSQVWLFQQCY